MHYMKLSLAAAFLVLASDARADIVANGDFASGLSGWTTLLGGGGQFGSGYPSATTYDVMGTGPVTTSAIRVNGTGGLQQTFSMGPGTYFLTADFAMVNPTAAPISAGSLALLMDGGAVFNQSFTTLAAGQVSRGVVAVQFNESVAGSHTLTLEMLNGSGAEVGYVTLVAVGTLASTSVPEPGPLVLAAAGLTVAAGARVIRSRRRAA